MDYGELKHLDHTYLWHPFTQMQEWMEEEPCIISAGDGHYLIDVHGRKYIDGVSSLWCNVHGHRKKELDDAIRAQLERIAHSTFLGLSHVPGIELAQKLISIAPQGLQRVFYSDSGATAVEIALKMAVQYWQLKGQTQRTQIATLAESYHGDTVGSMSMGYSETFHRYHKSLLFPVLRLTPPHVFRYYQAMSEEAALSAAIAEAAAARPLLIVLDDLESADRGSLELLRYLSRATRDDPVFWIFIARQAPAHFDAATEGRAHFSVLGSEVTLGNGKNSLFHPGATALVIHQGADDYMTDPAGNAGPRIACAVIKQ